MTTILIAIPRDVGTMIYRYVHEQAMDAVNKQYKIIVATNWRKCYQCFYDHMYLANWRRLPCSEEDRFIRRMGCRCTGPHHGPNKVVKWHDTGDYARVPPNY